MLINSDLDNLIGYTLPPGPDRDSRNAALERCSEDLSDDELAHILQNFINDFNYDMRAVAEEWWHMWGRLM
ncbi:hypothetical protein VKT23_009735 [Stygiomarasmius scandens]|uniref:Uncharacterized protein n=1 Tax=Marasmiellus scandens TaxID=2682957 RepID=A0ABR1JE19_9AGAR